MDDDDEVALLHAWRAGDRAAGDELMRSYYGRVLGFFRLRVPTVAEDLTQHTFLACTEGRERVVGSSVRGFLFGIARHLLLKHLEQSRRAEDAADLGAGQPQSILSPSGVIAQRAEHMLLLRALERLPDDTQVLIAMHYVEGMRSREIAEALGVPTSTVTTRLSRARESLREQLTTIRAAPQTRASLLSELDTWVSSLGPLLRGYPDAT